MKVLEQLRLAHSLIMDLRADESRRRVDRKGRHNAEWDALNRVTDVHDRANGAPRARIETARNT